jgi:hypothetical protein
MQWTIPSPQPKVKFMAYGVKAIIDIDGHIKDTRRGPYLTLNNDILNFGLVDGAGTSYTFDPATSDGLFAVVEQGNAINLGTDTIIHTGAYGFYVTGDDNIFDISGKIIGNIVEDTTCLEIVSNNNQIYLNPGSYIDYNGGAIDITGGQFNTIVNWGRLTYTGPADFYVMPP